MDRYEIAKNDRVFARLTMGGRTLVEFMMNGIASVGEVIRELRRMCGDVRGLAKLYIRNHSRGWALERGMMIYDSEGAMRQRASSYGMLPFEEETAMPASGPRMYSPWETH